MSKVQNFPNITKSVCTSLRVLKNSQGQNLSDSAYNLYLYFYERDNFFGKKLETSHDEIFAAIKCKETKLYEILAELHSFNLIQKIQENPDSRKSKVLNILHITLLPPSPFVLLRSTVKSLDVSHYLLSIRKDCFIEDEDEEITLKAPFINLSRDHSYTELLTELEVGDIIYFVAEPLQLEDGRWELRNECNLMSKAIRGLR